jgi:hypothetical protein
VSKHAELARKYLGAATRTATFKIGKRSIVGYRARTKLDVDEVVPLSRDAREDGLLLFRTTTEHYELFAIPGVGPAEVVELVKVGTHNRDDDAWKPVQLTVGKIFARAAFDVVLADAAGLIGVFHSKLSLQQARAIAVLLEREVPTGLEVMEGEVADVEVDEESEDDDTTPEQEDMRRGFSALFPRYIKERGRFHLWWD